MHVYVHFTADLFISNPLKSCLFINEMIRYQHALCKQREHKMKNLKPLWKENSLSWLIFYTESLEIMALALSLCSMCSDQQVK